ncbi:MAG: cation:proton antiporter [Clostridia bacterium]|nr:cation:proton antiporter [Clostridia bacterium]
MQVLLQIAVTLAAGLLLSRLSKRLGLPSVTAYLVAGMLIGPYVLGRLGVEGLGFTSMAEVNALDILSDVALGFIAFAIGNEFRLSALKKTGKQATVIAIIQALTATLFVDLALFGLHIWLGERLPVPMILILGAIATATAPAATLMVVRQYKADGPLTRLLLPIVALDDAVGLIVFAVSFGVAKAMLGGNFDLVSILVNPILEIVLSLLLGFVMGLLFSAAEKFFDSNSKRLSMSITFVILTVALSKLEIDVGRVHIGFSTLLVCMMLATVFCNVCDFSEDIMGRVDKWTAPLFVLFFALSGAELELNVFADLTIVGIGVVYILFRSAGKYLGALGSAKLMRCSEQVCTHLGITLLPQAGVALGMSVTVEALPGIGSLIRNIVLFGVLIYELVGPLLTKWSLTQAGEIRPKPPEKTRAHKLAEAGK